MNDTAKRINELDGLNKKALRQEYKEWIEASEGSKDQPHVLYANQINIEQIQLIKKYQELTKFQELSTTQKKLNTQTSELIQSNRYIIIDKFKNQFIYTNYFYNL